VSSQFLSGLLLAGPRWPGGLRVRVTSALVSEPYAEMTRSVMAAFGAASERHGDTWAVPPGAYGGRHYLVEPDASAASYFFAAAAITGGRVRVEGLGPSSSQGDLGFVDLLEAMGAGVERHQGWVQVRGPGPGGLKGIDVDLAERSDVAQTLAAVAVVAAGPTTVRGIGFVRGKETDRIGAVVTELRRLGIDASEHADGFTVRPGRPRPGRVRTYDDHRMAMSFALLGLVHPGIEIEDPGCVAKTFPGFWDALDGLRRAAR
jgi:3-phosphoshikimate 1-carboxyvinyltransferase